MILIIDNYDSFTYNLAQYIGELGFNPIIRRNNKISLKDIKKLQPTHIIISPGPGDPTTSGISLDIIKMYSHTIPLLGVCLGHQSIGYIFGGEIKKLRDPVHGKTSKIYHNSEDIFQYVPNPFIAARYHSLIISPNNLPNNLIITAKTKEGIIMACKHRELPLLRGIQFHPESLWTTWGKTILQNFILQYHR